MIFVGIGIGLLFALLLVFAYAVGYTMAVNKLNPPDNEEEPKFDGR